MPAPSTPSPREPALARLLLAVYVLLIAYASLHPLAGWRDPGVSPFAFLAGPWPRYVTAFDLAANFLGYLPFGLLCVLALDARRAAVPLIVFATLVGGTLSLLLETAQGFLPARISSNVDVLANLCGAAGGAIAGLCLAPALRGGGPLHRLRAEAFAPGRAADLGLALLALWLFAQLNPAMLLFGTGDLRDVLGVTGERHAAHLFVSVEAATTAANFAAVAMLVAAGSRPGSPTLGLMAGFLLIALVVKTLAFSILMRAENVFAWLTPGAQLGLASGALLAAAGLRLPRTVQLVLAAMLLMAATVLVNLAPPNPYLAASLKVWEQGHFLNFNGLTRLVSAAWPFFALGYLVYLAAGRRRESVR